MLQPDPDRVRCVFRRLPSRARFVTRKPRSERSSDSMPFPATRFIPFEAFPSPIAVPHHCGPSPPAVVVPCVGFHRSEDPLQFVTPTHVGDTAVTMSLISQSLPRPALPVDPKTHLDTASVLRMRNRRPRSRLRPKSPRAVVCRGYRPVGSVSSRVRPGPRAATSRCRTSAPCPLLPARRAVPRHSVESIPKDEPCTRHCMSAAEASVRRALRALRTPPGPGPDRREGGSASPHQRCRQYDA
jgi:hypothetical protein